MRQSVLLVVFIGFALGATKAIALEQRPFGQHPFSESLDNKPRSYNSKPVQIPFSESLGRSAEEQDRWRDAERQSDQHAVALWRTALDQDPSKSSRYHGLARALEKLKRYPKAIETLQNALRLNPVDGTAYYELGLCYYSQTNYSQAVTAYEHAVWYRPRDNQARRWLGYSLYGVGKYGEAADNLRLVAARDEKDFATQYYLGSSLIRARDFVAGARALSKAVALRPDDFNANFQLGDALSHEGKFAEAIPHLEKANGLRPDLVSAKMSLLMAYLTVGRFGKGFTLFPFASAILGLGVMGSYFLGIALAWWLSFRKKGSLFPSLLLSLFWLVLVFWGQIAFIFLPAVLPWLESSNDFLVALLLPAAPLLMAAAVATKKQIWGEAFRWPPRFGGVKTIALAVVLTILTLSFNILSQRIRALDSSWQPPAQKAMLVVKMAFVGNPLLAFATIVAVIPVTEEILFRGLIFAALRRWWRARWIIPATAALFALVHLDLPFLLPLFLVGLVLGWARARSGSIALPILIHVANNCFATVAWKIAGGL